MWTCAVPSLSRLRACFVKQVRCVNCTLQPDETLQVSCPASVLPQQSTLRALSSSVKPTIVPHE